MNFQPKNEQYDWIYEVGDYIDEDEISHYFEDYDDREKITFLSFTETCLFPTVIDVSSSYLSTLCLCIAFHFINYYLSQPKIRHIISGVLGLIVLYVHFKNLIFHFILLFLLFCAFIPVILKLRVRPIVTSTLLLSYLIICEFSFDASSWPRIRNVQMLIVMKIVSVVYDYEGKRISEFPSFLEFFGYIFCIGNCIFGPWVDYASYLNIYIPKRISIEYLIELLKSVVLSYLFFSLSMCYVDWFLQDFGETDYTAIYGKALEFRTGHYFIMFMSSSFALAAGFQPKGTEDFVTHPTNIEFLHSLGEVVISWNVPMHKWLKTYVFKPLKAYGSFAAVLGTYFISSLLHGLNYQLSGILLSLGIYTYVEYIFRLKMSNKFNACIGSKSCPKNCIKHKYTRRLLIICFVNLLFSAVALYHLSYLGFLIDLRIDRNLGFSESFLKWKILNFDSHWIVFVTYVIYCIL